MDEDLVSVVLPVYNGMPFLPKAVESVLSQTHDKIQLFIINDGSTDGTKEYLDTISDDRVHILHQPNLGLGETLNRLISLTNTKYIARMDSDDVCSPHRIRRQIDLLNSDDGLVMVGTGIHFLVGDKSVKTGRPIVEHEGIVRRLLKKKFGICHPSVMFKRSAFDAIGGYRVKESGEDLDFFLRMSEVGRLSNVPDDLLGYRIGNISLSSSNRSKLHLGYSYALSCAKRRRDGLREETFEEYSFKWFDRSPILKIIDGIDDISEKFYRKYIVYRSKDRIAHSALCFVIAAALRPHTVLERIILRLRGYYDSWF